MTEPTAPLTADRIVVGIDGSTESKLALRWAAAEARLRGATLAVVHVWGYPHVTLGADAAGSTTARFSTTCAARPGARQPRALRASRRGNRGRDRGDGPSAASLEVDAPSNVHAGIDGEAVELTAPLVLAILPAALRVRIPRSHPGVSPSGLLP